MALATALFLVAIIIAVILGIVFLIGLTLLIIGIVRKCKPKNEGKKSPLALIITGAVLMLPSLIILIVIAVNVISSEINRAHVESRADNVVEVWQNTHVTDDKGAEQALSYLLTYADKGDKDLFRKNFAKSIQEDPDFNRKMEAFFKEYPGGLAGLEFKNSGSSGGGSANRGVRESHSNYSFNVNLGDESYYLKLSFCYENDTDPDGIGVMGFEVYNLGGYVDYYLTSNGSVIDHGGNDYLVCNICTPGEVSARRIGGKAYRWTESSTEPITADEMEQLLAQCVTLDDAIATGKIGQPNGEYHLPNSNGTDYYYELKPEDGEARYVKIIVSSDGRLLDAWLNSPDRNTIRKLF